jgi:hypothetical protein
MRNFKAKKIYTLQVHEVLEIPKDKEGPHAILTSSDVEI